MVVWAGDSGRDKRDRQPLFFAYALLPVCETSAAPFESVNKKKRSLIRADTSMV